MTNGQAAVRHVREEGLFEQLQPTLDRFKELVRVADREALEHGAIPSASADLVLAAFDDVVLDADRVLGDSGCGSVAAKAREGQRLQAELLPYMLLSDNAERWHAKPRGYAGDYLTIARIYEDEARGRSRTGPLVDRCFLRLPAVRAVQNRRCLLAREIATEIQARAGECARVASLACGPAQEIFDVYATLADPAALRSTLVDVDFEALAWVAARRDERRLKKSVDLVNENLVHFAIGRRQLDLEPQDLVYSVGLIDYFSDAIVVKLMNAVHGMLRSGGRAIFGNFHPKNRTKAIMDHVLNWRLVHRSEEDMHRLFEASAFGRPCTRIVYEEQGINLFAECVRD
jgi:extracellular factor (EF) 3-hydroxypalmitic acid methyl ester biosynthesis protein